MTSRTQIKVELRKIGETAILRLLGAVPRRLRRDAGRLYANEAYRMLNNLKSRRPPSRANGMVIEWVAREYLKRIGAVKDGPSVDTPAGVTDNVGSPTDGPGERSPEVSIRVITEGDAAIESM